MIVLLFAVQLVTAPGGVRIVNASPCDVTDVNLSLGMSALLQFDTDPTLTFHADEEHFLVKSSESAKRTIAIIPHIKESELRQISSSESRLPTAGELDRALRTNLFVFFKSGSRLIFRLRFVEKDRADYVLRIRQVVKKGCEG